MHTTNFKERLTVYLTLMFVAIYHSNTIAAAAESKDVDKTDAECWRIASENFAGFTRMLPTQIDRLFGSFRIAYEKEPEYRKRSYQAVSLDKNTLLNLFSDHSLIDEISLVQSADDLKTIYSRLNKEFGAHDWENDSVYTYAPRKQEDDYWTLLKTNLKNLFGMKKEELKKILGPERCSSQLRQTVDYRVGCERLRFYLVNDRVAFLQRVTGIYGRPALFKQEVLPAPVTSSLWPIFEDKVDTLLGLREETYQTAMNISKTEIPSTINAHTTRPSLATGRSFVPQGLNTGQFWNLDDRIRASVSMRSGLVHEIVFEPWHITEDRALPHGAAETGWGGIRPGLADAVYTGAT